MTTFFFSSRRRHTRCGRDWSSDVCSSDLSTDVRGWADAWKAMAEIDTAPRLREIKRSEERRVGKECRSRWAPDQQKKKKTTHIDRGCAQRKLDCGSHTRSPGRSHRA